MSKLKLNWFSKIFSNPFHFCPTQYHLEKLLVQNQYVRNLQQFTINKEISNIQLSSKTKYDKKTIIRALTYKGTN